MILRFLLVPPIVLIAAHAQAPDPRALVTRCLHADSAMAQVASQYTYQEKDTVRELDSGGQLKKTESTTHEILFLGGKRYERLTEKDGKPLAPKDAARERARMDKAAAEASRLIPSEKEKRFADYQRERAKEREVFQWIPEAYDWKLLPPGSWNGRVCFLVQATPNPGYKGKYANLLRNMQGKIWIDKADDQWIRIEASVLGDISFGLFLAKLEKGGHFAVERTRVNDEVWLPKQIDLRITGRALVKKLNVEETLAYGEYRKFSVTSRIVETRETH